MYPNYPQKVTITLYKNVPFSNKYEEHPFFPNCFKWNTTSLPTKTMEDFLEFTHSNVRYFDKLEITDFNFEYSNQIVTSMVIELVNANKSFTDANYLKVSTPDNTKLYYFITNIHQLNGDTYKLDLECDVIASYSTQIMNGLDGVPVSTKRKHCHRYCSSHNTEYPNQKTLHTLDVMLQEDVLKNYKPKNVIDVTKSKLNITGYNQGTDFELLWLYFTLRNETTDKLYTTLSNNGALPITMMCIPYNVKKLIIHYNTSGLGITHTWDIKELLNDFFTDPKCYGAKLSPYPPFTTCSHSTVEVQTVTENNETYKQVVFNIDNQDVGNPIIVDGGTVAETFKLGNNTFWTKFLDMPLAQGLKNGIGINVVLDTKYSLVKSSTYNPLLKANVIASSPTVATPIDAKYEPKLNCRPVKVDKLKTQYSEETDLFNDIIMAYYIRLGSQDITLASISDVYGANFTIYTYVDNIPAYAQWGNLYQYQKEIMGGLSASPDYTYPYGESALENFNATQRASYTTSKIASGVTSGLAIAGGIGALLLAPTPMGKLAGATAIAGGVASIGSNIATAIGKEIDLSNTPDTINSMGNNFAQDICIGNTLLPYVVHYDATPVEKEMLLDYFYEYGYQVSRCCYFNKNLYFDNELNNIDNNIFGRTTFNYVQLDEDITGKIHSNIPPKVKEKISQIFMNGIKLYTLFQYYSGNALTADLYTYYQNKKYENAEYIYA